MEQRRVPFDFEIAFSHGGGLEGPEFRRDIDGDGIPDAAFAGDIVRDMRRLRVDGVAITNRKIIALPHKRWP